MRKRRSSTTQSVLEFCPPCNSPSKGQKGPFQAKKGRLLSLWQQVPTHPGRSGWIRGRKLPYFLHGLNERSSAGRPSVDSPCTGCRGEAVALFLPIAMSWLTGSRVQAERQSPTPAQTI